MKIGILIIATGRYIKFVEGLSNSINKNFLQNHDKTIYVFTDGTTPEGVVKCPIDHMKWPYPTLYRFRFILKYEDLVKNNDYLYYIDADSDVVGIIDEDIMNTFVVTRHCSSDKYKRKGFPYETRKESTAFIDKNSDYKSYFTGAFWGGKTDFIINMCKEIDKNIIEDENNGIIATWHDESQLNKFCSINKPTKILDEGYNYRWDKKFPYIKKIVPVQKKDNVIRDF